MYKKGISVFTGLKEYSLEKNIEYLRLAKSLGYEIVFSSAHINEASTSFEDLQKLIDEVQKLDMKLSLDISKPTFEKLRLPENLYALRLDYGFSENDIIDLSNKAPYMIELNASVYKKERILSLIEKGLNAKNIRVSFNYYPKIHTGHTIEFVNDMTKFFHSLGMTVGAFLPSHIGFRPPMYEGLPTVESHRKMNLSLAIEELKVSDVDEIMFGDAYASCEELELLHKQQKEEIIFEVQLLNKDDINALSKSYVIRPDLNDELLRLSNSRSNEVIEPFNTVERKKYDLTIDNNGFLRYKGEINIVLKDLEKDERVNVIGHLNTTDFIISKVKEGRKFTFVNKYD